MKKGFFGNDNETKEKALVVAMYCLVGLLLIGLGMLLMTFNKFNFSLFLLMLVSSILAIYISIGSRALYLSRVGDRK